MVGGAVRALQNSAARNGEQVLKTRPTIETCRVTACDATVPGKNRAPITNRAMRSLPNAIPRLLIVGVLTSHAFACTHAPASSTPAPCPMSQVDTAGWIELTARREFRMRLPAGSREESVLCFDTACGRIVTPWGRIAWSLEYGSHPIDTIPLGDDAMHVQRCVEDIHGHRAVLVTGQYSKDHRTLPGHYFAVAGFPRGNTMLELMMESASPETVAGFLGAVRTVQIP